MSMSVSDLTASNLVKFIIKLHNHNKKGGMINGSWSLLLILSNFDLYIKFD
jgi:hypothetical protein